MKKEWFEPGPDGESPFEREYYNHRESGTIAGNAIAAAFRALLAGEQSVDTQRSIAAALANGQLSLQDEITGMRDEVERLTVELRACKDERMAAEIERDAADEFVKRLTAERDALRARIDAGVRAWEKWKQQCGSLWLWAFPGATASQAWSDVCDALDADYVVYPIADADERKGERRKVIPARIRRDGFDYSMDYDTPWMTNRRKYNRRRTAGTIADRKGES